MSDIHSQGHMKRVESIVEVRHLIFSTVRLNKGHACERNQIAAAILGWTLELLNSGIW